MAKLLKLRRGTTTQHGSFTGAEGEVTVDTTKDTLVVHDGSTQSGHTLLREDMSNLPAGTIDNADVNASAAIAGTKIAPNFGSQNVTTTGTISTGSGSDQLNITHSGGGASHVAATGDLVLKGTDNVYIGGVNNETHIKCTENGSVELNHDNVKKAQTYSGGFDVAGNITVSGTVDGRDVATDGSKLDGIESGSTADQTNAEISAALSDQRPTMKGATFTDNGTSDPIVNITTDDSSPWALRIANDSHTSSNSAGIKLYQNQDGTGEMWMTSHDSNYEDFNFRLNSTAGTKKMIEFGKTNQDVYLFYAGNAKLNTSSTGVTVTGTVAATSYTGDGSNLTGIQPFPAGTKMLFQQTSAPTGWTKVTSNVENKALRVTSGTVGSGGSNAFTNTLASRGITANAGNTTAAGNISVANAAQGGSVTIANASTGGTVNNHTLSSNQMPSHYHNILKKGSQHNCRGSQCGGGMQGGNSNSSQGNQATANAGGSGAHSHGFSGSSHSHNVSFSGSNHSHNASFSGTAHNHSISVTNLDMAVQYIDVIVATKD